MTAAHSVLCTFPSRSPQFFLGILKEKPYILDLLFDCATLERPSWFPESRIGNTACESIVLLLHLPGYMVPGITAPNRSHHPQEWKAMLQAVSILLGRPDWVERIIEVWMHVEEEDRQNVHRCELWLDLVL